MGNTRVLLAVAVATVPLTSCGSHPRPAPAYSWPTTPHSQPNINSAEPAARPLPLPARYKHLRGGGASAAHMPLHSGGYIRTTDLAVKQTTPGHYQWYVNRGALVEPKWDKSTQTNPAIIRALRKSPNVYVVDATAACARMEHRNFRVLTTDRSGAWIPVGLEGRSPDTCSNQA